MRPVEVRAPSELDLERQLEERTVTLLMEVSANRAVEHLELVFDADEGLVAEAPNPILIHLSPGERRELEVPIRCAHWGTYEVGSVVWRARDPFGLFVYEGTIASGHRLKVYPHGETLQRLLRPLETQAFSGNQVARSRGEGIEFADLRPFTYGDQVRRVNWRATARRGEPWVNETHPERNSDIVIFLDTFAEARRPDLGTLDIGVRAAASLAALYLREKDRVGLVSFGGVLNWLTVTSGTAQLYRIVDSLLDSEILLSYAWKDLDVIPPRTLPPRALVFAFSPLLDERAVGALARPACTRLRPRRDRAVAVLVRARGRDRARAARVPALAASARCAPHEVRVARRADRRVARGCPDGSGRGGGAGIQAPRPSRSRLATGAVAVLAAAALAAFPASQNLDLQWAALAFAISAVLVFAVGLVARSPGALGIGLALLGADYAVLFVAEGGALDQFTPAYAAGLHPRRGARLLVDRVAHSGVE